MRFLRDPGDGILDELAREATADDQQVESQTELKHLNSALKECDDQRGRLAEAFSRGRLTSDDLDGLLPEIEKRHVEITSRIVGIEAQANSLEQVTEPVSEDLLATIRQRLDGNELMDSERQEIVSLLVSRIVVPGDRGNPNVPITAEIEYRFPRSVSTCTGKRAGLNYDQYFPLIRTIVLHSGRRAA